MTAIMGQKPVGDFPLSVYPSSQPVFFELMKNGSIESLTISGASIRSAFCGPCFGAGDVPANGALSIRHTTRNFPNREGSKPVDGQISSVALMDARSIAATALSGGFLTSATEIEFNDNKKVYHFNKAVYDNRIYQGNNKANAEEKLVFGPNIVPWPKMRTLPDNLLLKVAAVIHDPVTTTDELIPSGETSSYRSNPLRLAEFTLSRKDPGYVERAKDIQKIEVLRQEGVPIGSFAAEVTKVFAAISEDNTEFIKNTGLGSVVFARKPGDGSAREQAASCQKVLGGDANIALEYATKRYRSNLINWGMIPFTIADNDKGKFAVNDYVYVPGIKKAIETGDVTVQGYIINAQGQTAVELKLENLSSAEREIILAGCLINYYNKA
jgi:aconitate hydratase